MHRLYDLYDKLLTKLMIANIKHQYCVTKCKTIDYEDFEIDIEKNLNASGRCPNCQAWEVIDWLEEHKSLIDG